MPGKPEQLTELTKQLAESEGQRITLVETMNEAESELTRIRDENDSLKRVVSLASVSSRDGNAGIADSAKMSEMSLGSYVGRADPMEVNTEAAMEHSEKEFTEGRKIPTFLSQCFAKKRVRPMCPLETTRQYHSRTEVPGEK
ncbi:hypothetical protein LTR75_010246 [Friedmanniomyces endolithicus]|nr:hypothetical protein LTR75_010246 [Friedmanniomyces endolithicus]